jgi:site-specific DNA recombinase
MKHVRAVIAEYEREKIKERIQRGKRLKVKAGSVMVALNRPPFGYKVVEDGNLWKLKIYEPEAEIIRMIFDWYLNGDENGQNMTLRSIARKLTELKIPTPLDKKGGKLRGRKKRGYAHWSESAVGHYLGREVYCGKWTYGRNSPNPITVEVPAIIDPEIWNAVQKARKEKYIENIKNRKHNYLFARRIRCGLCTSVAVGTPVNGYLYYRCHATKKDKVAGVSCKAPHFRLELVEEVVWNWITNLLENPDTLQEGLNTFLEETENQLNPFRERLDVVESLLEENDKELDRLLELYLSGEFPKEVLISRKNDLETVMQSLENEKNKLLENIQEKELTPKQIENIFEFAEQIKEGLEHANNSFRAKREIIEALDVHVIITVEGKEKIVYAECVLGETSLRLEKSKNNDSNSGGNFRDNSTSICADYQCKNPRQVHRDQDEFVPEHARHQ